MISIIPVSDAKWWRRVVALTYFHDFYHWPSYHQIDNANGDSVLLAFSAKEYTIALPIVLREILVNGSNPCPEGRRLYDATSVYGYVGPIASHKSIPPDILEQFWLETTQCLEDLNCVTLFTRLHPLIPQCSWLKGLGSRELLGETISIDITSTEYRQTADYRRNHRSDIARLRKYGYYTMEDKTLRYLRDFCDLYTDTMRRVNAAPRYFFDEKYLHSLLRAPEGYARLFVTIGDGRVACGGIITQCCGVVQSHLAGTSRESLRFAPMKLLFDDVRRWAGSNGWSSFHLGGGVGAKRDSLFHFKAGFSKLRHPFHVWTWVIMPKVYEWLNAESMVLNGESNCEGEDSNLFPRYRFHRNP